MINMKLKKILIIISKEDIMDGKIIFSASKIKTVASGTCKRVFIVVKGKEKGDIITFTKSFSCVYYNGSYIDLFVKGIANYVGLSLNDRDIISLSEQIKCAVVQDPY